MISLGGSGTVVDQENLIVLVLSILVRDSSPSVQMDGILVNIGDLGFEFSRLILFFFYLLGFFFGYSQSTSDLDP